MHFADLDLDPKLLNAIEKMGFDKPTSIQSLAIPAAMKGRDILASSPTGTGKPQRFYLVQCNI